VVGGSDWLWINRYGVPLKGYSFTLRLKQYTKAAGIAAKRLSPHALRHFFALTFLKNGGDVMALQKLLGHSSLEMVRNYVNMTDDDALAKHRLASPLDRMGPLPGERRQVRLK
jgi:integrase/recombinase XerD